MGENEIEQGVKMVTGDAILNVECVLQHPGYYYLCAARCVGKMHAKITGEVKETDADLNAKMVEDLTLSVEQFAKRGSRRTSAYVELARCKSHHFNGKHDVALEYFIPERGLDNGRLLQPVMQIYRLERWYELLEEALVLALDCARKLEDEASIQRYSLELLSESTCLFLMFELIGLDFLLADNGNIVKLPSFIAPKNFTQLSTTEEEPPKKSVIEITATNFISFGIPSSL